MIYYSFTWYDYKKEITNYLTKEMFLIQIWNKICDKGVFH